MTIDPGKVSVPVFHGFLLSAVIPRPIALVSTVDREGNVNLSPFSFFNCFGTNPPILVFSPSRRGRDNTTKHTYENIRQVPEAVVHIVNYAIVQQTSLASSEYDKGVNEFVKAGFNSIASEKVMPPRVAEAPVAMECKVLHVVETGSGGGAGNLVVCEVVLMHVKEEVLTDGKIDPFKLDAVSRLGGNYYSRVVKDSIFEVPKPLAEPGIGIDLLPKSIKNSRILTGNDLGKLANIKSLPGPREAFSEDEAIHHEAKHLLDEDRIDEAWMVLLRGNKNG